jgi:gliding motility-associated-like protein
VAAEYFFNTDPGQGNGIPLSFSANANQNNSFLIPVNSLPVGFNRLYVRYKNNAVPARWSIPQVQTFYVNNLANLPIKNITELEYYIDTDPGFNNATPITITPASTIDQNVAIDLTSVPTGNHLLSVRAKDSEGFWSEVVSAPFSISACIPPPQPTASNQTRCGEGTVTFTTSGAGPNQEYRWYADALTNTILFSGDTYTTPLLTANEDYFVSIFDNSTSCESARRPVTATLTLLAKPTISPSGTLSICEGSSIFLTAPQGFSQYQWSNGATASQILVTTTGNYTVQTGDGTCLSQASDPVIVNVTPAPTKPVITVTGNTTICGSGSVELSGPAGFQYLWSTGATTQTITVTQTSVVFLTVRTASNCPSFPSDPVVVTLLQPPCGATNQPPVFNNAPASTTIEGKVSLDLTQRISDPDNNLDFSTLRLVNTLTTRGAPASINTDFELIIDYDNLPFTGTDRVVIEVCDLNGACIQQVLDIEVVGALEIFNGLSPNGDGINDIFLLKYIDVVEGASKNKVNIFNRWGDLVFDVVDYNNTDRVFKGESNSGRELPSGTYFYTIEFESGLQSLKGYITLIR